VRAGETRRIDVLARFLYGAPGAGLTAQTDARVKADPNPFPGLKDYRFGDERTPFEETFTELPETVTDGEGRAVFAFDAALRATAPRR
jgi:uncharacterized protein YfaS (alpha-2-macroglobulin family)